MALTWTAMKLLHPSQAPLRESTNLSRCERCARGTPNLSLKLVFLIHFLCRYNPEVGDLVIGRITEVRIFLLPVAAKHNEWKKVQPRRWKVDANARQDAVLMLSSVNLPGGVQVDVLQSSIVFIS
jgi:exosome complex RNA-binding protein Rrp4